MIRLLKQQHRFGELMIQAGAGTAAYGWSRVDMGRFQMLPETSELFHPTCCASLFSFWYPVFRTQPSCISSIMSCSLPSYSSSAAEHLRTRGLRLQGSTQSYPFVARSVPSFALAAAVLGDEIPSSRRRRSKLSLTL